MPAGTKGLSIMELLTLEQSEYPALRMRGMTQIEEEVLIRVPESRDVVVAALRDYITKNLKEDEAKLRREQLDAKIEINNPLDRQTVNTLRRKNVVTIGDLALVTPRELIYGFKGIGPARREKIKELLKLQNATQPVDKADKPRHAVELYHGAVNVPARHLLLWAVGLGWVMKDYILTFDSLGDLSAKSRTHRFEAHRTRSECPLFVSRDEVMRLNEALDVVSLSLIDA